MHATPGKPAYADALADCEPLGIGAHRSDPMDFAVGQDIFGMNSWFGSEPRWRSD
jgi:hypothetical protein